VDAAILIALIIFTVAALVATGGAYTRTRDHHARQRADMRQRMPEHEFRRPSDESNLLWPPTTAPSTPSAPPP
jgi:hypothetical protein